MARRPVEIIAICGVAGLVFIPVTAVLLRGDGLSQLTKADMAALYFTLWQAALSAALSTLFAIPVARAFARREFFGRNVLIRLMGAPFILPVIVAIMGLLAIFGGSGLINQIGSSIGLPRFDIYGYHGVILAHVFFNLPLAVRILLQGWQSIPSERLRLASSLNAPFWRVLELPMLMRLCPGIFAVVFVICLGSFAVALTLGGGPRATTIELAIYQAFKFDFDLGKAATLAIIQLILGLFAGFATIKLASQQSFGRGMDRPAFRYFEKTRLNLVSDFFWIAIAAAFLLLPIMSVAVSGTFGLFDMPQSVWQAALRSLLLAIGATGLTLLFAIPLLSRAGEVMALLVISVSSLVLGTGLFIIAQPYIRPAEIALPVTMVLNALMALPFVLRIMLPEFRSVKEDYARLSASLGLEGWHLVRLVYVPRLRRPLGFAAGLTAALSMGDLGVITLFADGENATLPLLIYRLMGSYQMEAARGATLVLFLLCLMLFWVFEQGGRRNAEA